MATIKRKTPDLEDSDESIESSQPKMESPVKKTPKKEVAKQFERAKDESPKKIKTKAASTFTEPSMVADPYLAATLHHAEQDNRSSVNIESTVPQITKDEPCWLGIDEAGRGPVCGPMTYGIAYAPISGEKKLRAIGFADSKQLTEDQREKFFAVIKRESSFMGWIVRSLSPADISAGMLGRTNYNLNALSHDTAIGLIRRVIALGVNVKEVFVDTVGKPEIYQRKLEELFPQLSITVACKADSLFPIVSAASICAKVTRDIICNRWQFPEVGIKASVEFGSGYPADPVTKQWISENLDPVFGFPGVVRFSWQTAKTAMTEKPCISTSWEDDDDDVADGSAGSGNIKQMFQNKLSPVADLPRERARYFYDRKLTPVTDF